MSSLYSLSLCASFRNALSFAFSAPTPLTTAANSHSDDAADTREPNAALSGPSRNSRALLIAF